MTERVRQDAARAMRRVAALALVAGGVACTESVSPRGGVDVRAALSLQVPAAVSQSETDALGSAFGRIDAYEILVTDSLNGSVVLSTTLPVVAAGPSAHVLDVLFPDAAVGLTAHLTVIGRDGTLELYRASGYARIVAAATPTPVVLPLRYTGPGIRGYVSDASGVPLGGVSVQLRQGLTTVASATTEPDGTYLFLPTSEGGPLGVGIYQVQPVAPPQQFVCPGNRAATVTATSAIVASFTASASGCPIDLLIVSGGDVDDTQAVAALFANTPNLNTQTFFYINRLPGLAYLSQFDAVLLFANGHFGESASLGSEIAAYAQAGGNVVIGSFYWQNRSDSNLGSPGWGTLEAIDPFASLIDPQTGVGGETYDADSLGVVTSGDAATGDALVQGLSALGSTGYRGGVQARPGTTVVARWNDGTPLVGYRILPGGQRLVAISLFPASGAAATGDVTQLWENAVTWTGAAGGPAQPAATPTTLFDSRLTSPTALSNSQTSQRGTTVPNWVQTFDDFTLASGGTVTRFEWQGIYCVTTVGAPAPAPTASSFTLAFYPDASDAPDTANALSVATYPIARVAQTLVTTNQGTCGAASPTSIPLYSYTVTLDSPFVASPGARYWVSVQAHTPDLTVFWGWRSGTSTNARSLQTSFGGATTVFDTDRGFALIGP